MNSDAQRIAIAKACPNLFWIHRHNIPRSKPWIRLFKIGDHPQEGNEPADPLEDLNAMHEVEKTLTHVQQGIFTDNLRFKINDDNRQVEGWLGMTPFHYVSATAEQRAEAFLRTIGKWDDSK